jgi:hypothetical protein
VLEILTPEWAGSVVGVQFDHGLLTVRLRSQALATRVKLTLEAALLDGLLALPEAGQAASRLKIEVSR